VGRGDVRSVLSSGRKRRLERKDLAPPSSTKISKRRKKPYINMAPSSKTEGENAVKTYLKRKPVLEDAESFAHQERGWGERTGTKSDPFPRNLSAGKIRRPERRKSL